MAGAKGNQLKARLYSTQDELARIDLNIVYNQNWQYSFKKYLEQNNTMNEAFSITFII